MDFEEIFGGAKWVAANENCSSPLFRATFNLGEVKNAVIVICGLGFFELHINGKRVSDDLLVPAFSQYNYRDLSAHYARQDKLSYRTWCMKYDVAEYLNEGENALGVQLGNGWYSLGEGTENASRAKYGRLKLCYRLSVEYVSGEKAELVSGDGVRWAESEITANNIYSGERHDYSLAKPGFSTVGYSDSAWQPAQIVEAAASNYFIQSAPTDKVIRTIIPRKVKDFGDRSVYEVGESVSGYALVKALGGEITVRYADDLFENCELDFESCGRRIQQEIFKNAQPGAECAPHFCWHGFRYFEMTNNALVVEVRVVHSDCAVTSSFESDNETLNWLYNTYVRTQLDNMHCSLPSDCPHIERLGYTGDGQLCAESGMLLFDTKEFYRKWMCDIADSQDIETGHVQHTAPFCGGGGGPAGWGGAIVIVPWMFYRTFGEKAVLEQYLPNMLKYFNYMLARSENSLVVREEKEWCLGDWCAPIDVLLPTPHSRSKVLIPEAFVNTVLFIKFMKIALEIGKITGKPELTAHLPEVIAKCTDAVNGAYFSPMTHCYCGDVQGANCLALDAGLGDEKTLASTLEKYRGRGMLDTGIIATDVLPRILFESGNAQLAFDLLTSTGYVSFNYMMRHGATTLWEDWQPERSHNHPMFGALTRYLHTYFLGITQQPGSVAFEKVLIAPKLVRGMNRAGGSLTTARGKISVSYEKRGGSTYFIVTLPEGVNAAFECGETKCELVPGENKITV